MRLVTIYNPFAHVTGVILRHINKFLSWSGSSLRQVGTPSLKSEFSDAERDLRSGDQWLQSAIAYLEFRSGKAWRKIYRADQRWNATRWYYLDAIRLLGGLRLLPAPACNCSKFCRSAAPKKTPKASTSSEAPTWSGARIRRAAKAVAR